MRRQLADALLHPQDRAYTVPQLYAWLKRCGLSFARWYEQAPYLPAMRRNRRARHTPRGSVCWRRPLQHAAVELLRGTMTKHHLIAYRDDRLGENQPDHLRRRCLAGLCTPAHGLPWTLVHPGRGAPRCRRRPDQSASHLSRPRPPARCGRAPHLRGNRRQPPSSPRSCGSPRSRRVTSTPAGYSNGSGITIRLRSMPAASRS